MLKKLFAYAVIACAFVVTGCSSVPMDSPERDSQLKAFAEPPEGKAGLYIYRSNFGGGFLKKTLYVDGNMIGETANHTYFYVELAPGTHLLETESEFGKNRTSFDAEAGNNYFARQYIKTGVFVGGAGIKMVTEAEGKKGVMKCNLAK